MRDEYDIKNLNPRKNPYAARLKKQVTINLNVETVDYFKDMSEKNGPLPDSYKSVSCRLCGKQA